MFFKGFNAEAEKLSWKYQLNAHGERVSSKSFNRFTSTLLKSISFTFVSAFPLENRLVYKVTLIRKENGNLGIELNLFFESS